MYQITKMHTLKNPFDVQFSQSKLITNFANFIIACSCYQILVNWQLKNNNDEQLLSA